MSGGTALASPGVVSWVDVTVSCMAHVIVDASSIPAGHGPHPAASPYDRRISEALPITAFEVYQVELPPGAETVPHDHLDDCNDDVYAIIAGDGWIVIDEQLIPVTPGQFVSVELHNRRHLRAGPRGLTVIAICAEQRGDAPSADGDVPVQPSRPVHRESPEKGAR